MPSARVLFVVAGAAALAGCGDADPPTREEIAAESAELVKPRPGRYTSMTKLVDYELPGASPQDADRFETGMRALAVQNRSYCLSQREADQGFEDMLRRLQAGDCKVQRFEVDDGELDAQVTCTTVQGVISRIGIKGTNEAERSHSRLSIEQQNPAVQGATVKMVLEVDSLREGEC